MSLIFSIVIILIITYGVLFNKTKFLVVLSVLSVFADIFRINLGASLLFVNIVGFLLLPKLLIYYKNHYNRKGLKLFRNIISPLWINFLYLIILGIIFGFLFPWSDSSSYRSWAQNAGGRSIIQLVKLFNEFIVAFFIFLSIASKKISFRFVIYTIGWVTFCSFIFGLLGIVFITYKIDLTAFTFVYSNRFLGLNGEPKIMGRNSAFAYIIILFYYLKVEQNRKLLLFIIVSALSVILSLSASAILLFAAYNAYILLVRRNFKLIFLSVIIVSTSFLVLQNNQFFVNSTQSKIDKALFGADSKSDSFVESYMSRFDVFDHLGLLFLYNNPQYALSGTGPNLISIPASRYLKYFPEYSFYADLGGIDSVPNVMFNNVLCNSGILGVFLYTLFFVRLYKKSSIDKGGISKHLVIITLLFNMVFLSINLLFITGIIAGNLALVQERGIIKSRILRKE